MSAPADVEQLTRGEVLSRVASTAALVITPNRRLAIALKQDFDKAQYARGLKAWQTGEFLPFTALVERLYQDALYTAKPASLPVPLTSAQQLALWERVVSESRSGEALLSVHDTAVLAGEAWSLAQSWRLASRLRRFPLNEDASAFVEWTGQYERETSRASLTDAARLPDIIAERVAAGDISPPPVLICYGFDLLTPQQEAFFAALRGSGCELAFGQPERRAAAAQCVPCADTREEIRRAAAWARARLECNRDARIGIVVPDLARQRNALVRALGAITAPVHQLPAGRVEVLPFNVSLAPALSSSALVSAALLVLELAGGEIEFGRASRLIRSPFIGGSETEFASRARLDARLRRHAEPAITLERLAALSHAANAADCPLLAAHLAALRDFRKAQLLGTRRPSQWAKEMLIALRALGFPGERALDSVEFQTLAKWHEMVAAFAALDRVVPSIGYSEALSHVRQLAVTTLFQPETPHVPIQVLGVLEAAAVRFDHLWVMGLSAEAWPPAVHPNPFIPVELQRAAGVPQSSAAAALAFARRITAGWLRCAQEVVVSYPQREADRECAPSPLISDVVEAPLTLPDYAEYREVLYRAHASEWSSADATGAPLAKGAKVRGGSSLLQEHAACPFRAFAHWRLGAQAVDAPHPGLDPMERGTLVHRVLAEVWRNLKTSDRLQRLDAAEVSALLNEAAEAAIVLLRRDRPQALARRFADIEKGRLVRLAAAWLEEEKKRPAFTVVATEAKRAIEIGGLALEGRLDRVDELADGRRIVLDYKTGSAVVSAWLGRRPDEPQVPLYLVAAEPAAVALAFALIRCGDMKFAALARDPDVLPGVAAFNATRYAKQYGTWQDVIREWRRELERIAAGFAAGEAAVDPKEYPDTCRHCDVKPLCRIHERAGDALERQAP